MSRKSAAAALAAASCISISVIALVGAAVLTVVFSGAAVFAALGDASGEQMTAAVPEMITATESNGRIVVAVTGNAPFVASVRRQVSPPLLFLDIDGLEAGPWVGTLPVGGKALREVGVLDAGPRKMRLVLRLNYLLDAWKLERLFDGSSVRLEVSLLYRRQYSVVVEPGLTFTEIRLGTEAGPLLVEALTLDMARRSYTIRVIQAGPRSVGAAAPAGVGAPAGGAASVSAGKLSRLTNLATAYGALAAINGAYFAPDGRPLGLLIIEGRLVSGPVFHRTALALTDDGQVFIDNFGFRGEARVERWAKAALEAMPPLADSFPISDINRPRGGDELIAYTPEYGPTTRTNNYGLEVAVAGGVVTAVSRDGNMPIPKDGVVLSAHGAARHYLEELAVGDPAAVRLETVPDYRELGVVEAIGGGPRLLRDGRIEITAREERLRPDVAMGRAPRTAVGITRDGRVLLVTVNGRRPGLSTGVSLVELAQIMLDLGAKDAMNLDGGGSTTMVIRGQVFNFPSDGAERPVNSALVVIPRAR